MHFSSSGSHDRIGRSSEPPNPIEDLDWSTRTVTVFREGQSQTFVLTMIQIYSRHQAAKEVTGHELPPPLACGRRVAARATCPGRRG